MVTQLAEVPTAVTVAQPRFPRQGQWTYEDWLNFPNDGWKYEIIDGVLSMSPPPAIKHQRAVRNLLRRMDDYVEDHDLGELLLAPCGVRLSAQAVPVEPDILFVKKERLGIIGDQYVEGVPDLIVEIISPAHAAHDRRTKFDLYQQSGVSEYWLVDYQAKTVEVFTLAGDVYKLLGRYQSGQTSSSHALAGFTMDVDDIFAF